MAKDSRSPSRTTRSTMRPPTFAPPRASVSRTTRTVSGRRAFALVAGLLAAGSAAFPSGAAALECAPKPDNPTGYQVTAVKADQVEPPATTPPIAILDSGVAAVPELGGRLRAGVDVTTGGENTSDTDGHGTAVASVAAAAA